MLFKINVVRNNVIYKPIKTVTSHTINIQSHTASRTEPFIKQSMANISIFYCRDLNLM